ncbi:Cytidylate kinase [uncultured archaeon]|nr:Cytidylate kinase [uncultured archaeon]
MLIGIVGLNGSGKDTVAQYLVDKYSFVHVDLGEEVRKELKRLGKNYKDRSEMREMGDGNRQKFGHDYWARAPLANYSPKNNLVITSLRHPAEVDLIKSKGGVIVEVFADLKTRFERTLARVKASPGEHGDVGSFEEFKMKQDRELKDKDPARMQMSKCISDAEYRLDNNGAVGNLEKEIETLLSKIKS